MGPRITQLFEQFDWLIWIALVFIGAVILTIIFLWLDRKFHGKAEREPFTGVKHTIASALPTSLFIPLTVLVWVIAIVISLELAYKHWSGVERLLPFKKAQSFAIVAAVMWWLLLWLRRAKKELQRAAAKKEANLDLTNLDVAGKIITLVVLFFGLFLILQIAGVDLKALATLGGFGALALGYAGKDIFANYFSGFMLHVTHPFGLGDSISVPEKNIDGVVEHMGWYVTSVRGDDKRPIYIPNSLFATTYVVNTTRMTHRRIEFKMGLRYKDLSSIDAIAQEMREMMYGLDGVDQTLMPIVSFTNYAPSSVDLSMRLYTRTTDWEAFLAFQQGVLLRCADIVHRHSAEFAFPTTTLDLPVVQVSQMH